MLGVVDCSFSLHYDFNFILKRFQNADFISMHVAKTNTKLKYLLGKYSLTHKVISHKSHAYLKH